MIKITTVQQVAVTRAIMIQIEEERKRNLQQIESKKQNVQFHEIHDGCSDARPKNGELVLIRYEDEEDESYDTVYFFEAGTQVVIKPHPHVTKTLEKTGFYKVYAGAGVDETDEFCYISPKELSHWGRYPKFNK
ncbi:MAG: hypothetical protein MSB11_07835 [Prevotella sp.]|nr:hypothetical protein [Prevotella sp.]